MSETARLHWFNSTNPEKVRLALEELGIAYERVHVDLSQGEHKTDAYRDVHPRAKVPALEIDGDVLWESGAILNYLGQREARLWPTAGPALMKALNLIFLESAAFQAPAGVFFINRKILPSIGKSPDEKRMDAAQKKIDPVLRVLAEQLADSDYLLGDFSLVDLAYAPSLPWLDLDEFPTLVHWRKRLMTRDAWTRCEVAGPV